MTKNKSILIGCIAFPIILIVAFFIGFASSAGWGKTGVSIPDNAWLQVSPTALIADYSEFAPMRWMGTGNSAEDMARKITAAASDDRIKGILLEPHYMQIYLPSLNQVGKALEVFKKSGKPVVAYGETMMQGDYLFASYASQIYMEPSASAGLLLEGVSANIHFYKELFDKIGVKMHVMQIGEYKGAGEPYSQTQLNPGTKANLEAVLAARYAILKNSIATRRKISPEQVNQIFEQRGEMFIKADKAKSYGLIDFPMSRLDMLDKLKIDEDKLLKLSDYKPKAPKSESGKVAVVYLSGQITPSVGDFDTQSYISSAKVKDIIDDIRDDKDVKAIVIRVNSPGGSALESEKIYQQLTKLKKDYPVVISMGGMAASGGYYISCAGDVIYADEATITGSIGVISMIPETEGLGRKIGLRSQTLRFGKYAGAFNMFEKYDPQVLESLHASAMGTFEEFKGRVVTARKYTPAAFDSVSGGRVFSAAAAKQNHLIDQIGDLDAAVARAASMVNLSKYSVVNFPKPESFLTLLKNADFMKVKALLKIKTDPAAAVEAQLRALPAAYEWQYLMPYNFEEYEER